MRIKLTETLYIEQTRESYDLYELLKTQDSKFTKKENIGKLKAVCHGYFHELDSAILKAINIITSYNKDTVNIKAFLKEFKAIKEDIINNTKN
jgi:hypothetical protein